MFPRKRRISHPECPILQLNAGSYDFPVLECDNPAGSLDPGATTRLRWHFRSPWAHVSPTVSLPVAPLTHDRLLDVPDIPSSMTAWSDEQTATRLGYGLVMRGSTPPILKLGLRAQPLEAELEVKSKMIQQLLCPEHPCAARALVRSLAVAQAPRPDGVPRGRADRSGRVDIAPCHRNPRRARLRSPGRGPLESERCRKGQGTRNKRHELALTHRPHNVTSFVDVQERHGFPGALSRGAFIDLIPVSLCVGAKASVGGCLRCLTPLGLFVVSLSPCASRFP